MAAKKLCLKKSCRKVSFQLLFFVCLLRLTIFSILHALGFFCLWQIALMTLYEYNAARCEERLKVEENSKLKSEYRLLKLWFEKQVQGVAAYNGKRNLGSKVLLELKVRNKQVRRQDLNCVKYLVPFNNIVVYFVQPSLQFANGDPEHLVVDGIQWNLQYDSEIMPNKHVLKMLGIISNLQPSVCHWLLMIVSAMLFRENFTKKCLGLIDLGSSFKSCFLDTLASNLHPLYVYIMYMYVFCTKHL